MSDRVCPKCGTAKPEDEFYASVRRCKECHKAGARRRYKKKKKDPEWLANERARGREKGLRQYHETNKHSPSYWKARTAYNREYRRRNPERTRAHSTLNRAVRAGEIVKPDRCEGCKRRHRRLEGHHEDYTKPLEVVWLCPRCHAAKRRKDQGG